MDNNNTESTARRLGAIFLIIGWVIAIVLVALLINEAMFKSKPHDISETEAGKQIIIYRDYDSHFRVKGAINGVPVTFLIDTGATSIAVSADIAAKAGLKSKARLITETANGEAVGYLTTIDKLLIADITIEDTSGVIVPALGAEALLGMNILKRFIIKQTADTLTLTVPLPNTPTNQEY